MAMNTWIIPCNVKFFDIIEHVKNTKTIVWKKSAKICDGDTAFIYVGNPYKEITYKCKVISLQVDDSLLSLHSYAKRGDYDRNNVYMELQVEKEYKEGISLQQLQELGMFMVRKQTRLYGPMLDYIEKFDQQQ